MHITRQRVVWVIGASGAIGSQVAARLLAQGDVVVVSSRSPEVLPSVDNGYDVVPVDITDRKAVEDVASSLIARHGTIDALVVCTTLPIFGDFLELDDDDWFNILDTKLLGSVRAVRAVLPGMIRQCHGRIVLISGRGGTVPPPRHLPGACANTAINLLVQGLATAHGAQGIRINAVSPGPVASPRLDAMQRTVSAGVNNALGCAASPDDVADAVLFLLSDHARHITGTSLQVDGGRAPTGAA
jgi:NAD(P)-dependent dehydrogenase (short-subunit alcohol dehydrogenase family)